MSGQATAAGGGGTSPAAVAPSAAAGAGGVPRGRRLKIFISSGNAVGQSTGYGQQVTHMVRAFRRAGHEVVVLGWSMMHKGLSFKMMPFSTFAKDFLKGFHFSEEDLALFSKETWVMTNPLLKWPAAVPKDLLNHLIRLTEADVFIAFQDIFVFGEGPYVCPSYVWMPLHFFPLEHQTFRVLDDFTGMVAMTEYGRYLMGRSFQRPAEAAAREGVFFHRRRIDYVPHGGDLNIFCPLPGVASEDPMVRGRAEVERAGLRRRLGWPQDAFVVLIVGANTEGSNRKAFDAQLGAACQFAQDRRRGGARGTRGKTHIHIHTKNDGEMDIARIFEVFGELGGAAGPARVVDPSKPNGRTLVAPEGPWGSSWTTTPAARYGQLSQRDMATMYRAADVLLSATCAEGFGVPIVEAQLCGLPVVTNATTSAMELTRLGLCVPSANVLHRNDFCAHWVQPDPSRLRGALHRIAAWSAEERAARIRKAMPLLQERYGGDAVQEGWKNVIQDLAERIDPEEGTVAGEPPEVNRALRIGRRSRAIYSHAVKAQRTRAMLESVAQDLFRRAASVRARRNALEIAVAFVRERATATAATGAPLPTAAAAEPRAAATTATTAGPRPTVAA